MEPVTGMAALIAAITAWVTAAFGYVTEAISTITASGNELLLLMVVAVPLVGTGVGLLRRLIKVK